MPITEQELSQILAGQEFIQYYGVELYSLGDGEATIKIPFQKKFERPGGVINGPVFMAAADLVVWLALFTKIERAEAMMSVTTELNTAFLNGARGDFLCTGKILKLGQRLIYGTAESRSLEGKILSHHTVTYIRPYK